MSLTIASVFWGDLAARRAFREHGKTAYMAKFELRGVGPQAPPSTRVIGPVWEHRSLGADQDGQQQFTDALVVGQRGLSGDRTLEEQSAAEMARSLVDEFTIHALGMSSEGFGKGVWICAGKKPSKEETDSHRGRQAGWARYLVDYADQLWLTDKRRQVTGAPLFRKAAEWVGEDRDWVHTSSTAIAKTCPFCGQSTSAGAPVCRHCGRTHDPELMYRIEHELAAIDKRVKAKQAKLEQEAAKKAAEEKSQRDKDFSQRPSTMTKRDQMDEMQERIQR